MDINHLCPNCMRETRGNEDRCGLCGYDLHSKPDNVHALQPYSILQGKYLVGNVIGEGGFGITYIGLDLNLEIRIAIKEFYPNGFVTRESHVSPRITNYTTADPAQYEKWKESFVKEARRLARFSDLPGIVHVRDFFQENNTAYIVMEYVEGKTLKEYLKEKGGRLEVRNTLELMRPVIRSLGRVHEAGIVHRDISPDNIMIQKEGSLKLIDFGAARDFGTEGEKSLSVLLKPGYAPEEQYRSKGDQGPWTDVYAMSATIYRCITGEKPMESMERMRDDRLKQPSSFGIDIASETEETLMAGMAVYAENRIRNMEELEKRLYTGLAGNPGVTTGRVESAASSNKTKMSEAVPLPEQDSGKTVFTADKAIRRKTKLYIVIAACVFGLAVITTVFAMNGRGDPKPDEPTTPMEPTTEPAEIPEPTEEPEPEVTTEPVVTEPPTVTITPEPEPGDSKVTIKALYRDALYDCVYELGYIIERIEFTEMNSDGIPEMLIYYQNSDNDETYKESVYGIREGYAIRLFHTEVDKYNLKISRNGSEAVTFIKNKNNAMYRINNNGYELFRLKRSDSLFGEQLYSLSEHYTANDRDYIPDSKYSWMMVVTEWELDDAVARLTSGMNEDPKHTGIPCYLDRNMSLTAFDDAVRGTVSKCDDPQGLEKEVDVWKPTENEKEKYIGKLYVVYQCVNGMNLYDAPFTSEEYINNKQGPVGAGYHGNQNGDEFLVRAEVENENPESAVKQLYLLKNNCYCTSSSMSVAFIPFYSGHQKFK